MRRRSSVDGKEESMLGLNTGGGGLWAESTGPVLIFVIMLFEMNESLVRFIRAGFCPCAIIHTLNLIFRSVQ